MEENIPSQNFAEGNNFYIYSSIDDTFGRDILAPFTSKVSEMSGKSCGCSPQKVINIYISSYGGRLNYTFDLIALIEKAKKENIEVATYVTSNACSGASLIAVAGSKRYISSRAFHLLHYARGGDFSHNPEMIVRNTENGLFTQGELIKIYKKYTKVKGLEKKLLADNYMINGGEECIKLPLADELIN